MLRIVHDDVKSVINERLFNDCFFFKQKTAYEVRISDWSSDVCSSDLSAGIDRVVVGAPTLVGIVVGFRVALRTRVRQRVAGDDVAADAGIDEVVAGSAVLAAGLVVALGSRGIAQGGGVTPDHAVAAIGRASGRARVSQPV